VELTITEAAQTLDCSVDTVRRHIRRGKLSARKDEHGRYLIQFDDPPTSIKSNSAHEQASTLHWLKPPVTEPVWPEASAWQEGSDSKDGDLDRGVPHQSRFAEEDPPAAPQRRRDDPGLDKRVARLLEERQAMIHELQMWRNEAMAAQVALEELRRLMPRALEPKRAQGWWRFGR
jgi:excisionase family DNA binding protein